MTCWALVPIKAPAACKSRLRAILGEREHATLVGNMLGRVIAAASKARGIDQVALLGPERHGLSETIPLLADHGGGDLNAALAAAMPMLVALGVDRVVIVPADLPRLTPADIEALAAAATPTSIGIARDHHRTGTNGIALTLPSEFHFAFGQGSFFRHRDQARALGLRPILVKSETLAFDVDEPAQLQVIQ